MVVETKEDHNRPTFSEFILKGRIDGNKFSLQMQDHYWTTFKLEFFHKEFSPTRVNPVSCDVVELQHENQQLKRQYAELKAAATADAAEARNRYERALDERRTVEDERNTLANKLMNEGDRAALERAYEAANRLLTTRTKQRDDARQGNSKAYRQIEYERVVFARTLTEKQNEIDSLKGAIDRFNIHDRNTPLPADEPWTDEQPCDGEFCCNPDDEQPCRGEPSRNDDDQRESDVSPAADYLVCGNHERLALEYMAAASGEATGWFASKGVIRSAAERFPVQDRWRVGCIGERVEFARAGALDGLYAALDKAETRIRELEAGTSLEWKAENKQFKAPEGLRSYWLHDDEGVNKYVRLNTNTYHDWLTWTMEMNDIISSDPASAMLHMKGQRDSAFDDRARAETQLTAALDEIKKLEARLVPWETRSNAVPVRVDDGPAAEEFPAYHHGERLHEIHMSTNMWNKLIACVTTLRKIQKASVTCMPTGGLPKSMVPQGDIKVTFPMQDSGLSDVRDTLQGCD